MGNGDSYLCPEDTECGGAERRCVRPTARCGDSVLDDGEQCDDGNVIAGDGCGPSCRYEVCGNGILDPHEICDDGNTRGGDGCSADCLSREVCGNGIIDHDAGEVCDDGVNDGRGGVTPPRDGDGCSKDCRSIEICGNGIVDVAVGEICDDGNTVDGDHCSSDCRSTEQCNNRQVDPGEECDHGLYNPINNPAGNDDGNECRSDCLINRCGDGHVDTELGPHHEDCDGAPPAPPHGAAATPVETAACNLDCTLARCGDGKVNRTAGEDCDDGNTANDDGCSASCKIERCGDGATNHHEACDPTDPQFGPAQCNADCTLSRCGDGKLNPAAGEQCDDGNTAAGDGCSPACRFEHCGNGVVDALEDCDGAAGPQPCSASCRQERCGNAILDVDPARGVVEQCDDGNITDGDGCSHLCKLEFCGDGATDDREPCDPTDPEFGPGQCNPDCTLSRCGDGKLNLAAGEQCDDGNTTRGDGCSASCRLEFCGNGVVDPPEDCDGAAGLQPCSASCHQERCGNGILDDDPATGIHEQCDDGNSFDNDGCSHDCKFEFCGDGIVNDGEPCDRALTPATCNLDCTISVCGDGKVNRFAAPPEQCDDGNLIGGDGCSATCTFE